MGSNSYIIRFINRLKFKFLVLTFMILWLSITTVFIVFSIPIYIFRMFISKLANYLRPDLGKILTTRSAIFSVMDIYTKPALSLVSVSVIKGNLQQGTVEELWNTKLNSRNDFNGNFKYCELRQYVHSWMGFPFWKWDNKFDLKNHVTILKPENFTPSDAKAFREQLLIKPFAKRRSPWEFIIVQNYVDDLENDVQGQKSLLISRLSHSLCDGYSMLKVILDSTGTKEELEELTHAQKKIGWGQNGNVLFEIWRWVKMPWDFVYHSMEAYSQGDWGVIPSKYSLEYRTLTSQRVSIDFIKTIKNGYSVGFTSVILSCISAGIHKGLSQINRKPRNYDTMYTVAPFPIPGTWKIDKLRNYVTLGLVKLPIGEQNSTKRLQKCHQNLLKAKKSAFSIGFFLMTPFIGGLFNWMMKALKKPYFGGICLTSFPGPKQIQKYGEHEALDTSLVLSLPRGSIGVAFTIVSYNGGLRFTVVTDKAIIQEESQLQAILDAIIQELDTLMKNLS